MTIENYIFDLDGTLIDSADEITFCIKTACDKLAVNIDENRIKDFIGKPINEILQSSLSEIDYLQSKDKITKTYRELYDYKNYDCKLYQGVLEFLNKLITKNKKLFILTNKPSLPTNRMLKYLKIHNLFHKIYTNDTIPNIKDKKDILSQMLKDNELNPKNTVLIGDTIKDMEAAKKNNVLAISALWGYEKNKDVFLNSGDFGIESLKSADIFELIDKFQTVRNKYIEPDV